MALLDRAYSYLMRTMAASHLSMAMARAAATSQLRAVDPTDPATWEFVGLSQNGEDGILEVLAGRLTRSNRYFVEVGSDAGIENNTAWLAIARKYCGLMVEGSEAKSKRSRQVLTPLNHGVEHVPMLVSAANAGDLVRRAAFADPDVFSLDIDSVDYFVARAVLDAGLRPKIIVVEYNSAFGPERAVTVPESFSPPPAGSPAAGLYYGCSVGAYRHLFEGRGYRFLTVDRNGVNAVFVDPAPFDPSFLGAVRGVAYRENAYQQARLRCDWREQSARLAGLELVEVAPS
jgi:hypothetical protein